MAVQRIPIKDRTSWLEMRKQDVTASDVGAICGVEAYKSAAGVWLDKVGRGQQQDDNNLLRRGRLLEPAVLAYVREEQPHWDLFQPGVYLRDPELRLGATPDAVARTASGEVIVQCKVVGSKRYEAAWGEGPPMCYRLQTLTEAMLWGAPTSYVAALVLKGEYQADIYLHEVRRHPGAEAKIIKDVAAFWAALDSGASPKVNYRHDLDLMAELYVPKDEVKDLTGDNMLPGLLDEYKEKGAIKAEAEKRQNEIKCEILAKLEGATRATLPGWRISNTMTHRKEHMVKASSYPTLRVTKAKEGTDGPAT